MPGLVLHLGHQDRLAAQAGRAGDPVALGLHADDLRVPVLGDLPDQGLAIALGHPVPRLDPLFVCDQGVELFLLSHGSSKPTVRSGKRTPAARTTANQRPVENLRRAPVTVGTLWAMEVTEALAQLGGSAELRSLELVSRRKLRKAVVRGQVVRHRPGSYALPTLDAALSAVRAAHGARSHLSAALHWGWELKAAPPLPMITVPRGRNLSERRRIGMQVFWAHLTEDELDSGATAPLRTVVDCRRDCRGTSP